MPAELIGEVVVVAPTCDGSESFRVSGFSAFDCSKGNAHQVSGLCANEEGVYSFDKVPQAFEIRFCLWRNTVKDLQQLDD